MKAAKRPTPTNGVLAPLQARVFVNEHGILVRREPKPYTNKAGAKRHKRERMRANRLAGGRGKAVA